MRWARWLGNQMMAPQPRHRLRSQAIKNVAVAANMPADLLGRRADIAAARWRVEASSKDVVNAKTQFYPNINLVAFAGFSSIGLGSLLDSGSQPVGRGPGAAPADF
jgi:outer membrane protein TolC